MANSTQVHVKGAGPDLDLGGCLIPDAVTRVSQKMRLLLGRLADLAPDEAAATKVAALAHRLCPNTLALHEDMNTTVQLLDSIDTHAVFLHEAAAAPDLTPNQQTLLISFRDRLYDYLPRLPSEPAETRLQTLFGEISLFSLIPAACRRWPEQHSR